MPPLVIRAEQTGGNRLELKSVEDATGTNLEFTFETTVLSPPTETPKKEDTAAGKEEGIENPDLKWFASQKATVEWRQIEFSSGFCVKLDPYQISTFANHPLPFESPRVLLAQEVKLGDNRPLNPESIKTLRSLMEDFSFWTIDAMDDAWKQTKGILTEAELKNLDEKYKKYGFSLKSFFQTNEKGSALPEKLCRGTDYEISIVSSGVQYFLFLKCTLPTTILEALHLYSKSGLVSIGKLTMGKGNVYERAEQMLDSYSNGVFEHVLQSTGLKPGGTRKRIFENVFRSVGEHVVAFANCASCTDNKTAMFTQISMKTNNPVLAVKLGSIECGDTKLYFQALPTQFLVNTTSHSRERVFRQLSLKMPFSEIFFSAVGCFQRSSAT